jgi:hypothetical protein
MSIGRAALALAVLCAGAAEIAADSNRSLEAALLRFDHPGLETGSARRLAGRVLVVHVFASAVGERWSEAERAQALASSRAGLAVLEREARERDIGVSWAHQAIDIRMREPRPPDVGEAGARWTERALELAEGGPAKPALRARIREAGATQGFYLIHVDDFGLSFALAAPGAWAERAVLFRSLGAGHVSPPGSHGWAGARPEEVAHEVLHLFGAPDLYTPKARAKLATAHFPDDIMLRPRPGATVSWYIGRRVGWADALPLDPYAGR